MQLGKFSEVQMISLILHSIYIVHSGSSFFFTQRRVSVPSFHSMRERFWVFCILACIFVPKIMSFGLLFSYARTFLTVAFIVLFGIGTMALFYDQLGIVHVYTDQFLRSNFLLLKVAFFQKVWWNFFRSPNLKKNIQKYYLELEI